MKKVLSCLLAISLLLGIGLGAATAQAATSSTIASSTTTVSASGKTITWTAPYTGILTVSMGAADPGWAYRVYFPDGSSTLLNTGTAAATAEYDVEAGSVYSVTLYAYNKAEWCTVSGEITYSLTFSRGSSQEELKEYALSDTALQEGTNALTLDPGAVTTIYTFAPEKAGTYRFVSSNSSVKLGYWGAGKFYLQDSTEDKSNILFHTITSVGQKIMLGVSGVSSCVLSIQMTEEYVAEEIQTVFYESTHTFSTYDFSQQTLTSIDIFDDAEDVPVLGSDGLYHYGSANGPLITVNMANMGIDIKHAAELHQLTAYLVDDQGKRVKYDYSAAMMAYYEAGMYPVTEELGMMLQQVGAAKGWFNAKGFLYPYQTPDDPETAWLGICYYAGSVTTPTLELKYPAVSFEDTIVMDVFFNATNLDSVVEMGLITYSKNVETANIATAEHIIPGYTWSETDGLYQASTQGIAPHKIGSTYYFAVYAKLLDGTYIYTKVVSYSPLTYANNILSNADSSQGMKTLVAAMLNYGAAAQTYFGVDADNLMNSSLTDAQKALVADYSDSMVQSVGSVAGSKVGIFANNGGFSKRYPNITLEGAFSINYFFSPATTPVGDVTLYYWSDADCAAATTLTRENATGSLTMTGETELASTISGIAAKDLDSTVYVAAIYTDEAGNTWASGVLPYSIGAYCQAQANTATGAMQALAQATAVYSYYAKQLFS